jgi:hypothetical protein
VAVLTAGLSEKLILPVADIGFSKVSKHFRSLDTFWILLRAFLCFHDPMHVSVE